MHITRHTMSYYFLSFVENLFHGFGQSSTGWHQHGTARMAHKFLAWHAAFCPFRGNHFLGHSGIVLLRLSGNLFLGLQGSWAFRVFLSGRLVNTHFLKHACRLLLLRLPFQQGCLQPSWPPSCRRTEQMRAHRHAITVVGSISTSRVTSL